MAERLRLGSHGRRAGTGLDEAVYLPLAPDSRRSFYETITAADRDLPIAEGRSLREMIDLADQQHASFRSLFLRAGSIVRRDVPTRPASDEDLLGRGAPAGGERRR